MKRSRRRLFGGMTMAVAIAVTVAAMLATTAAAAVVMHGTFVTPNRQGNVSYVPARGIRGGSEGTYTIGGKRYPGSLYAAVGGGTGMVWYYGVSGVMAGTALVTAQPDGTYKGPITFLARSGATTDAGTVTVTFP